jgi:hypothetical protein
LRAQQALETLPWVEKDSVEVDIKNRRVTFAVVDLKRFDAGEVRRALERRGFSVGMVTCEPPPPDSGRAR